MIADTMLFAEIILLHGTFKPQLYQWIHLLFAFSHDASF
jgi:hypothetical protein